jgi:hypothetical protein
VKYFKGDETEVKMYSAGLPILESIGLELDQYFDGVYGSVPLGEFIYDQNLFPLTNAIRRQVFVSAFKELLSSWSFCGTFESYISVFKKIFGDEVEIEFTVPGPGELVIDIATAGFDSSPFVARTIENNAYVFDNVVDDEGDNIAFAVVKGIETQSELEKILFTMVPNGIFTTVSLTIGS